ncbi:hypothetical protein, partial [Acidovorax sp.]
MHRTTPPTLPRGHLLALLVAGVCGAGGLALLTWALASRSMDLATRIAFTAAGAGLVASALLSWWLVRQVWALRATASEAQ